MLFNLILFLLDAIFLGILARYPRKLVFAGLTILLVLAGVLLGAMLSREMFRFTALAAYGIFLHGPILLLGTALIWRKSRKLLAVGLAVSAVALLAVACDAFLIEPHWLDITHYEIASPKIARPLRIVVIADLQTDEFGAYEKRAFDETLAQKPDIILLAGDYLQLPYEERPRLTQEMNAYLQEIHFTAPLGVYVVQGNIDCCNWQKLFDDLDVNLAIDRREFLLADLSITCLSLSDSFSPIELKNPDPQKFHLVVGHVPNYARGKIDADLLIAGHTHGGQVQLPFVGPLITLSNANIPRSWASGLTALPSPPDARKLLVSRGIGMERGPAPRLRFLCRPELAVIDLVPIKQEN
jgi:predicted MPP superfamily phosphohydrolase